MQKPDGISTNLLMVSSELTLYSDTCGLCFRPVVEITEFDLASMLHTEEPLLPSWTTSFGPQPTNSQWRREVDFDFSGFKRIQIVSPVLKFTTKEIHELSRPLVQYPFPAYAAEHWEDHPAKLEEAPSSWKRRLALELAVCILRFELLDKTTNAALLLRP